MLPSGYCENQGRNFREQQAGVEYPIAITKWEFAKVIKYAKIIRKLQWDLGFELTDFECWQGKFK
jgi:hypothetical protein